MSQSNANHLLGFSCSRQALIKGGEVWIVATDHRSYNEQNRAYLGATTTHRAFSLEASAVAG